VLMSAVEEATTRSRELGASASQRSLAPSDPIQ
jgi:hypothetical protein